MSDTYSWQVMLWSAEIVLLTVGFGLLLWRFRLLERMQKMLRETKDTIEEKDRALLLERRKQLAGLTEGKSLWSKLDRELEYSGIRRKFPGLTVGRFLVVALALVFVVLLVFLVFLGPLPAAIAGLCTLLLQWLLLEYGKAKNRKKVGDELMKFLDFLGNYSIAGGEITQILSTISRYMSEPLRSVLTACELESRISGDVSMAILAMADRISHPQFKQLVRNMEVTYRYGADFSALVRDSRRSLQDYEKQLSERRTMIREATINMILLLGMSVLMLVTLNLLVGPMVWNILLHTVVGYIALGIFAVICLLYGRQVLDMNR